MFDTSDFPQPNVYNIKSYNKKVVGVMKDENNGNLMIEFVGLRSKMYALRIQKKIGGIVKKAKGVKKKFLSNKIEFNDYIDCLRENSNFIGNQATIKSYYHKMFTISTKKIMLNGKDDKRYVLDDGIRTLAIGHYKLNK